MRSLRGDPVRKPPRTRETIGLAPVARSRNGQMIRIANGPHLDEESRAMLASGRANASVALFIDSVLEMRGEERPGEAFAGVMLEAEPSADMREDALARGPAAIHGGQGAHISVAPPASPGLIRVPPALADAIREAEARKGWKSIGYGVRQLPLREAGDV